MNKPAYIMRDESITVIVENRPYTVEKTHPNFLPLRKALLNGDYSDIPNLVSVPHVIKNMTRGSIRIENEKVFYKNYQLHGVVVNKLIEMLKAGATDADPLLLFIGRLMANPSANSVNELYTFLSYKNLPITPTGTFLAYKGVKNDFYSRQANKDTIVVQGKTDSTGAIFNGVGETIEVARRSVDDVKDNHCSFGLHVGSYDYANNWAGNDGRLLLVEVDPADAVSVPTDANFQKLRTARYKVVADITPERKEIPDAVYDYSDDCDDCDEPCEDCGSKPSYDKMFDELNAEHDNDFINLKIRNYIENSIEAGTHPSIKQIQSRMKNFGLSCEVIEEIVTEELGYRVASDDGSDTYSSLLVYHNF